MTDAAAAAADPALLSGAIGACKMLIMETLNKYHVCKFCSCAETSASSYPCVPADCVEGVLLSPCAFYSVPLPALKGSSRRFANSTISVLP